MEEKTAPRYEYVEYDEQSGNYVGTGKHYTVDSDNKPVPVDDEDKSETSSKTKTGKKTTGIVNADDIVPSKNITVSGMAKSENGKLKPVTVKGYEGGKSANSDAQVEPSDGEKPDFTKEDPWSGLSEEFMKKSADGFVPTIDNPLPPWTGESAGNGKYFLPSGRAVSAKEYNTIIDAEEQQYKKTAEIIYERDKVKLADGSLIAKDKFAELDEKYQEIGKSKGFDEMVKAINDDYAKGGKERKENTASSNKLDDYIVDTERTKRTESEKSRMKIMGKVSYDIVNYLRDGGNTETLKREGFDDKTIEQAQSKAKEVEPMDYFIDRYSQKEYGKSITDLKMRGQKKGETEDEYKDRLNKNEEILREAASKYADKYGTSEVAKQGGNKIKEFGLSFLPVYTTKTTWNDSTPLERGVNIAIDVLSIIPAVRATSAEVRAGTRIGKALTHTIIAEVRAPIDFAVNGPFGAVESVADVAETAVRTDKLPVEALEIRSSTVRVPLKQADLPASAAKTLRDTAAGKTIKGLDTAGTVVRGEELTRLELNPSALNKVSPAAVHATPDVTPFLDGVKITEGREGGLFLSPNLHTRFTKTSAFGDAPAGGIPGAVIIRDEKTIAQLKGSGKIYKGATEIEKVLPGGSKLDKPSQTLFTRDMQGNRLTLLVFGKPFTRAEIATMKLMGAADTVTNIFKHPYKISKKNVKKIKNLKDIEKKLNDLSDKLKTSKSAAKARQIERQIDNLNDRRRIMQGNINRGYSGRIVPVAVYSSNNWAVRASAEGRAEVTRGRAPDTSVRLAADRITNERAESRRAETYRAEQSRAERERANERADERSDRNTVRESDRRVTDTRVPDRYEPPRDPDRYEPTRRTPDGRLPERLDIPRLMPEPLKLNPDNTEKSSRKPTADELKNALAWPQGFGWWVIFKGSGGQDYSYFFKGQKPPKGIKNVKQGPGEAYRGIQQHKGNLPVGVIHQMGAINVKVSSPSRLPGKSGAINFNSVKASQITSRGTKISGSRGIRITAKRPRLRR